MGVDEYAALFEPLGLTRLLGCGAVGCVYSTKRGTVVKLTTDQREYRIARFLEQYAPWEKAARIPELFAVGTIAARSGRVAYIERENLTDLRVDAEDQRVLFRVARKFPITDFLYGGGRLPAGLRSSTVQLVTQMRGAVRALEDAGVIPADLDKLENWGTDDRGGLKIRDFSDFDIPGYL